MDANDIQHNISMDQMMVLLQKLNADPVKISENEIISKTICHGGNSHKLYYYDNSKRFTCYTGDCGYGFSIYDLIMWTTNQEFYEALCFVKDTLNIKTNHNVPYNKHIDMRFFNKFKQVSPALTQEVKIYNNHVLNSFRDLYHISWIRDNITSTTMKKYNIKFNVLENQIVIPHYNINNDLIGIRVRNLDKRRVDKGQKYMPLIYNKEMYNHNTRNNLYGLHLNHNIINKKRQIIIFEAEKSVMQLDGYWDKNNSVALGGSNLSGEQIDIIHQLGVNEVVFALDKEYKNSNSEDEIQYVTHLRKKFINKLLPFYRVSVIMDREGLLNYKDSPTDQGVDVWNHLYKNRFTVTSVMRD